jgi:hypothetical protein
MANIIKMVEKSLKNNIEVLLCSILPTSNFYWNPKIEWEGNNASISFYNNDVVKKYKVIIQGMDNLGRLTYFEKIITP